MDFRSLGKARLPLATLVSSLGTTNLADIIGAQKEVRACVKNLRRCSVPAATVLSGDVPLETCNVSLNSGKKKNYDELDCKLELFVEPIKFRDVTAAYSVRLRLPTNEESELPAPEPRLVTEFTFNRELHTYVRTPDEEHRTLRGEMGHSSFYHSLATSAKLSSVSLPHDDMSLERHSRSADRVP